MSLLVLGTTALDTLTTPYGKRKDILGGSVVHFSMLSRLFVETHLVSIVGDDFPKKYIDFLSRKGIILGSLKLEKGRTFRWQGEYKGDLNTAITRGTELGVLPNFRPRVRGKQRNIGYVFMANIDPAAQHFFLKSLRSVKLAGLDSMNYWIANNRSSLTRLLKKVNVYFANEAEARQLSGEYNLVRAAQYLRKMGPAMIVIKKGEHGVLFYSDKFIFLFPAYPTSKVIDPTGAGDSFAGAFMGYLARQQRINQAAIKKAVAYAVVGASFTVEGFGVKRSSQLTIRELNSRLKHLKEITGP